MSDAIVDREADDSIEEGSAAEAILMEDIPAGISGTTKRIDPAHIEAAAGQRKLSNAWVRKHMSEGWIEPLGYGIVLNPPEHPAPSTRRATPSKKVLLVPGVQMYQAIIGQHRSQLALKLAVPSIPAFVLDQHYSDRVCAQLFARDARSIRALRSYDVHRAALIYKEPRALVVQMALDDRGITLVPGSPKVGQVSCIRALEKICGDPVEPDIDRLEYELSVLYGAFPPCGWPDAMVQGLTWACDDWEADGYPLPEIAELVKDAKRAWRGDVSRFISNLRTIKKTVTSPSPHVAHDMWIGRLQAISIKKVSA